MFLPREQRGIRSLVTPPVGGYFVAGELTSGIQSLCTCLRSNVEQCSGVALPGSPRKVHIGRHARCPDCLGILPMTSGFVRVRQVVRAASRQCRGWVCRRDGWGGDTACRALRGGLGRLSERCFFKRTNERAIAWRISRSIWHGNSRGVARVCFDVPSLPAVCHPGDDSAGC